MTENHCLRALVLKLEHALKLHGKYTKIQVAELPPPTPEILIQ